jgi:hypothetical protein
MNLTYNCEKNRKIEESIIEKSSNIHSLKITDIYITQIMQL